MSLSAPYHTFLTFKKDPLYTVLKQSNFSFQQLILESTQPNMTSPIQPPLHCRLLSALFVFKNNLNQGIVYLFVVLSNLMHQDSNNPRFTFSWISRVDQECSCVQSLHGGWGGGEAGGEGVPLFTDFVPRDSHSFLWPPAFAWINGWYHEVEASRRGGCWPMALHTCFWRC